MFRAGEGAALFLVIVRVMSRVIGLVTWSVGAGKR